MYMFTRAFACLALLAPILAVLAETAPLITATVAFPESNPFQHIVNGERNPLTVTAENPTSQNVTVVGVSGSTHIPDSGKLVKNLTALSYNVKLIEKGKISLPYQFHSEFRPGDLQLKLWVEYTVGDDKKTKHRVDAFESIVTVVEPPASIFDLQMILTYLIVIGLVDRPKSKKIRSTATVADEPVDATPVKGSGVYSEDWIPQHHLRSRSFKKEGVLSSGDESGAASASGTERRRSTRRK
ncbi:hypothetical protein BKA62DRAFT_687349 [Auriculariales sp. MPI-PUGE-AT-0066]|nr:hypothetical protein BKA62DRAFT_687349 [Auriculariales sp. MPI-PUGE-AT-0066]